MFYDKKSYSALALLAWDEVAVYSRYHPSSAYLLPLILVTREEDLFFKRYILSELDSKRVDY